MPGRGQDQPKSFPSSPFDNPAADIIIRSGDGVDLHVHSIILAEASPIFADMLAVDRNVLSGNQLIPSEDKPVVELEETGQTLDHLLRLCYPVRDPEFLAASGLRPVLCAAMKYRMNEATELLKEKLCALLSLPSAGEIWAVACGLGLENEAKKAARAWVRRGIHLPDKLPDDFNDVTAGAYFRLMKFRRARGNVGKSFKFCEPNPEDAAPPKKYTPYQTPPQFTERPFSDIICRASDGAEFRTHKIILAAPSPCLRQRVLDLEASLNKNRTLPTLTLDSPSEDLGPVLELLYPANFTAFTKANGLVLPPRRMLAIATCARKHEIAFVDDMLQSQWRKTVSREPLLSYLLAVGSGLEKYAQIARNMLCMHELYYFGWIPELESTPASVYHALTLAHAASTFGGSNLADKSPRALKEAGRGRKRRLVG